MKNIYFLLSLNTRTPCIYFPWCNANANFSRQVIVFRAFTFQFPDFSRSSPWSVEILLAISQIEQPTPVLRASYYTVFRGEPSVLRRPGVRKVMRICTTLISSCRQNEALLRYRFRVCKPVDRASSRRTRFLGIMLRSQGFQSAPLPRILSLN